MYLRSLIPSSISIVLSILVLLSFYFNFFFFYIHSFNQFLSSILFLYSLSLSLFQNDLRAERSPLQFNNIIYYFLFSFPRSTSIFFFVYYSKRYFPRIHFHGIMKISTWGDLPSRKPCTSPEGFSVVRPCTCQVRHPLVNLSLILSQGRPSEISRGRAAGTR